MILSHDFFCSWSEILCFVGLQKSYKYYFCNTPLYIDQSWSDASKACAKDVTPAYCALHACVSLLVWLLSRINTCFFMTNKVFIAYFEVHCMSWSYMLITSKNMSFNSTIIPNFMEITKICVVFAVNRHWMLKKTYAVFTYTEPREQNIDAYFSTYWLLKLTTCFIRFGFDISSDGCFINLHFRLVRKSPFKGWDLNHCVTLCIYSCISKKLCIIPFKFVLLTAYVSVGKKLTMEDTLCSWNLFLIHQVLVRLKTWFLVQMTRSNREIK